jgi:DNA-binding transcriptional regulator YiaG
MTWASKFRSARGSLYLREAAAVLCGCPVATIRDWEQGRREPPEWVQLLVLEILRRQSAKRLRR